MCWARRSARPLRARQRRAPEAADRPRASAWATRCTRRNVACTSLFLRETGALAGAHVRRTATRWPTRLGLHRRQRPVLPQHRHGDGQGHDRPGAQHRARPPSSPPCAATAPTSASASAAPAIAWFTAPVEMPVGLYFPGFSAADANPDMGDSAIVETIGLGGFAMAAAPAVVGFVGAGSAAEAAVFTHSDARDHRRPRTPSGPSPRSISPALPPASMFALWSKPASRPPSIPASPTRSRASARSAPAWCARRWRASARQCGRSAPDRRRHERQPAQRRAARLLPRFGRLDAAVARDRGAAAASRKPRLMMATPANKAHPGRGRPARSRRSTAAAANDLILAVRARVAEAADAALAAASPSLDGSRSAGDGLPAAASTQLARRA